MDAINFGNTTMIQLEILDKIHERLACLTVENGYPFTVVSIKRAKLTPFKNEDLPAINYFPGQDTLLEKLYSKEKHKLDLSVNIYTVERDQPFTDIAYQLAEAVITAINRDANGYLSSSVDDEDINNNSVNSNPTNPDPSYDLGGMIESLTATSILAIITEGQDPWCGTVITFEAIFYTGLANAKLIDNDY